MTPPIPPDRDLRVRSHLDALVTRSRTPGLQYRAVGPEGPILEYNGGWSDLARRVPMSARTTMMAYSMSKTITAAAVLQLVAAGVVGLDDPLERYAETPYDPAVTIRFLLAHLSGIPNPIPLRWVHPVAQHATFDEARALAAQLAAHPMLAFPPGTKYRYSNLGYWLLGSMVERASGQRFASYIAEHVLAPLAIAPADLGYAIPDSAPHANGYLEKCSFMNLAKGLLIDRQYIGSYEGRWLRIEEHYLNGPAFGGLVGTARGFGRFLQDQLQPQSALFATRARDLFYTPQQTSSGTTVPMTLGWHVGNLRGTPFFYKEGGGGGFHCEMRIYSTRGVGTVIMSNATAFDVKSALNTVDPECWR